MKVFTDVGRYNFPPEWPAQAANLSVVPLTEDDQDLWAIVRDEAMGDVDNVHVISVER